MSDHVSRRLQQPPPPVAEATLGWTQAGWAQPRPLQVSCLLGGGQHPTSRLRGQGCQADGLITLKVKTHFKTGLGYVSLKLLEGVSKAENALRTVRGVGTCATCRRGRSRNRPDAERALSAGRRFLLSSAAPGHRLRRAQAHGLSRRPRIQSRGLRSVAGTGVPLKGHFLAREPGRMFNSNGQRLENHGFSIR